MAARRTATARCAEQDRRLAGARVRSHHVAHDAGDRLVDAGEQHADAVDRAALDGFDRLHRQVRVLEPGDELRELLREPGHLSSADLPRPPAPPQIRIGRSS
jgi:hypothetical protein